VTVHVTQRNRMLETQLPTDETMKSRHMPFWEGAGGGEGWRASHRSVQQRGAVAPSSFCDGPRARGAGKGARHRRAGVREWVGECRVGEWLGGECLASYSGELF
jgi:hypothetical protein